MAVFGNLYTSFIGFLCGFIPALYRVTYFLCFHRVFRLLRTTNTSFVLTIIYINIIKTYFVFLMSNNNKKENMQDISKNVRNVKNFVLTRFLNDSCLTLVEGTVVEQVIKVIAEIHQGGNVCLGRHNIYIRKCSIPILFLTQSVTARLWGRVITS